MAGKRGRGVNPQTEDPPEELLVLHLDDEDNSDPDAPQVEVSVDQHGRVAGVTGCVKSNAIDVRTKVTQNTLSPSSAEELVRDCEAAFVGDSFWLGVDDEPRCALELLARAVFKAHCDESVAKKFSPEKTGVEWWVQLRKDSGDDSEKKEQNEYNPLHEDDSNNPAGVSFHWDKDENLVDSYGVNIHPVISTVTYVTGCGAPTLVMDKTAPVMYEEIDLFRGVVTSAVLSHPEVGKHLSFDGRMLHGAPREMGRENLDENKLRVSFLVNIWLGHKPRDLDLFPEEGLTEFQQSSRVGGDGYHRWVKVANAMENEIKKKSPGEINNVAIDKSNNTSTERLEYAFGETGTEHLLEIPSTPGLKEWKKNGGTVGIVWKGESMCEVVVHPSQNLGKSKRRKA